MSANTSSTSRYLRTSLFLTLFLTVVASGQERTQWRTAADITSGRSGVMVGALESMDEYRLTFVLRPDERSSDVVRVTTDSASTSFRGFGDGTAGDVVKGTRGFTRMKRGDRLQVTGIGADRARIAASEVRLLGRSSSPATPPASTTTTTTRVEDLDTVSGTVRSVNGSENRIVIETSSRRLYTVRGTDDTPVMYRGTTYRIRNLEVGDEVSVDVSRMDEGEIRARRIDVVRNVADTSSTRNDRTYSSIVGTITRIDSRAETFRVQPDTGREIRVDASDATDASGRALRFADLRAGDGVEVSGRFESNDVFRAVTVRRGEWRGLPRDDDDDDDEDDEEADDDEDEEEMDDEERDDVFRDGRDRFVGVVVTGRIVEALSTSDYLVIEDEDTDREIRVLADDELVVRSRTGAYITASQLRIGERVSIRAYRHSSGTYIAQTIRTR